MKFILFGIGSGLPDLTSHQSALYVQTVEKKFLFDCGEGCSYQLLHHNLAGDALDAIFISHYHPDHVSGLFMVLQMLRLQMRQKPLQLFLPERPAVMVEFLQYLYTFPHRFSFQLRILPCTEADLYHKEVTAALTDHLRNYEESIAEDQMPNPMNSYSFRISSPEGDLVYSSDINTTDCVLPMLRDCHTAIVDAFHPEPEQILKLQYAGIPRILLTHRPRPELLAAIPENAAEVFQLAMENKVYTLG